MSPEAILPDQKGLEADDRDLVTNVRSRRKQTSDRLPPVMTTKSDFVFTRPKPVKSRVKIPHCSEPLPQAWLIRYAGDAG
jgi:hypothetical protein